jgi:hypothetical protein
MSSGLASAPICVADVLLEFFAQLVGVAAGRALAA